MSDELTQEDLDRWPNCPVADCENKINLRLKSGKCWPHTVGLAAKSGKDLTDVQRKQLEEDYLLRKSAQKHLANRENGEG